MSSTSRLIPLFIVPVTHVVGPVVNPKAVDTPSGFIRRSRLLAKSPGVPSTAIAIFADRRDWRLKLPISDLPDISD